MKNTVYNIDKLRIFASSRRRYTGSSVNRQFCLSIFPAQSVKLTGKTALSAILCSLIVPAAVATISMTPMTALAQSSDGQVLATPKLRNDSLGHYGAGPARTPARSKAPAESRSTSKRDVSPKSAASSKARPVGEPGKITGDSTTASAAPVKPTIMIPSGPAEDRRAGAELRDRMKKSTARKAAPRQQIAGRSTSSSIRALRRSIVAVARREWKFFGGAEWRLRLPSIGRAGLEDQPGYRERVIHYWKRGLGRSVRNTRIGWSGAFISFVMKEAGAGKRFPYGGSHTWYMARTIKARVSNDRRATFFGYRLSEVAPRPGDMVCNTLTRGITYDTVGKRRFGAHCDIVVEKHSGHIKVIGGNLTNSVRKRTLLTDPRGFLYAKQPRRIDPYVKRWLVVIRAQ